MCVEVKGRLISELSKSGQARLAAPQTCYLSDRGGLVQAILCIDHRQCPVECVIGPLRQVNIPSCLADYRCNVMVGYGHKKVVDRRRLGKRPLFVMRNAIVASVY